MKALSLAYHDVVDDRPLPQSDIRPAVASYTVRRDRFEEHLRSIAGQHATVEVIRGFREWAEGKPAFLTFDDGAVNAYCAADVLEKQGWRGHFFITTNWIGRTDFLNRQQIRELHERGHVIGSHSCSHPARMSHLSRKHMSKEWSDSCATLSDILSAAVKVASVPNGYYSQDVGEAAAEAGIEVLFTSEATSATQVVNGSLILGRYMIRWNTSAEEAGALAAGYLWPQWKQTLLWEAKKLLKGITGESYLAARRIFFSQFRRRPRTASPA